MANIERERCHTIPGVGPDRGMGNEALKENSIRVLFYVLLWKSWSMISYLEISVLTPKGLDY